MKGDRKQTSDSKRTFKSIKIQTNHADLKLGKKFDIDRNRSRTETDGKKKYTTNKRKRMNEIHSKRKENVKRNTIQFKITKSITWRRERERAAILFQTGFNPFFVCIFCHQAYFYEHWTWLCYAFVHCVRVCVDIREFGFWGFSLIFAWAVYIWVVHFCYSTWCKNTIIWLNRICLGMWMCACA